jgi:5'-3' exonuclease
MGIKNLHYFLKKNCPTVYKKIPISKYAFKKIAIDTSIYVCRFKNSFGQRYIDYFFRLISILRYNEINPVFIYDSKSPPEKKNEKKKRWQEREKKKIFVENLNNEWMNYKKKNAHVFQNYIEGEYLNPFIKKLSENDPLLTFEKIETEIEKLNFSLMNIRSADFLITKEVLNMCHIPYIDSDGEAESTCSMLLKSGKIAAILTEDTDILASGCSFMIHNINFEESTFIEIDYQEILKQLKLTSDEFLDFCILCGTDYNEATPDVDIDSAYKLIYQYKSIENIKNLINYPTNCDLIRSIYKNVSSSNEIIIPYCGIPNKELITKFYHENNCQFDLQKFFQQLEINIFKDNVQFLQQRKLCCD